MVDVDTMDGNVVYFVLTEQKLIRYHGGCDRLCPGNVAVGTEVAIGVGRFELDADILPALVVEAGQHVGRAELPVVEQGASRLVVAVNADLEPRYGMNFLHNSDVEHVRPF